MFKSDLQHLVKQALWHKYLLAITAMSTNLIMAYTLIVPKVGNNPVANFEFPQVIELNAGKIIADVDVSALAKPKTDPLVAEIIKARQTYQYVIENRPINLEINYLVGTRGDVPTYLQTYTAIAPEILETQQIKKIPDIGHHTLFTSDRYAHLSSCISPRSLSSVTQAQFSQYRYQNDLKLRVGWDWLNGKASIRDRRCLWIHLATPIEKSDVSSAYQALQNTWQELYQWWLPNFPPLINN